MDSGAKADAKSEARATPDSRDDGGKVYKDRRLRLGKPGPVQVTAQGQAPQVTLRYRLRAGEQLTWQAAIEQRNELRTEKQCPASGAEPERRKPPHRTLRLGYQVNVVTRVRKALPQLVDLQTEFQDVQLTLPPSLSDQRDLLTSLVRNTRYRTRMSRRGQIHLFELERLTGSNLKAELKQLRSPLTAMQPILPTEAVGAGAAWKHQRRVALSEPGGKVTAIYATSYRLEKMIPAGKPAQAVMRVTTSIRLQGTLMGESFEGSGRTRSRIVIDTRRGLMLSARGSTRVCSAVMGQTSTNHTTFSQKLLGTRLTAPGKTTPREATPKIKTPKIKTPEIKTPEIKTPEIKTPEIKTPEIKTPEIKTPKIKTPKIKTPEIKTPDKTAPAMSAPTMSAPRTSSP